MQLQEIGANLLLMLQVQFRLNPQKVRSRKGYTPRGCILIASHSSHKIRDGIPNGSKESSPRHGCRP